MEAMQTLTRNFRVLWFGSLITDLGNAMTLPFIVLYIQTLGDYSTTQLNFLGAAAFAVTYACKALIAPLWGRLADQKGRKLMCLRASGMMTLTILGVGLAPNVVVLLILRAAQGAFSGYINNANALISITAPAEQRGLWLSKLITGSISGTLMGPLLGSVLANTVGYRGAFMVTSSLMALVFAATWWGVQEDVTPVSPHRVTTVGADSASIRGALYLCLIDLVISRSSDHQCDNATVEFAGRTVSAPSDGADDRLDDGNRGGCAGSCHNPDGRSCWSHFGSARCRSLSDYFFDFSNR